MNAYIRPILISLFLTFVASLNAAADEVTDVINEVAAKLVQQLPMDKKIALKSLSPEETGLPEDFLRKLTSDLEAALLTASDFEINLANRLSLEEVWQEAIEFNNADFDDLYKDANADVMLMMSPRAISKGVEIAITAYALTGDSVGKTLASSGSVLLPIDLQANLGVDVNDLNKQMAQVLAEIEKVGQTGGLISNPNTYAEFYHNARLLQQRGEVDLAIANLEQAIKHGNNNGFMFFDPIFDFSTLIKAKYGERGALKYVEKRLKKDVSTLVGITLSLLNDDSWDSKYLVQDINSGKDFPPALLALWLKHNFEHYGNESTIVMMGVRRKVSEFIIKSKKTGQFYNDFIDNVRASNFLDTIPGIATPPPKPRNKFYYNFGASNGKSVIKRLAIWDPISTIDVIRICAKYKSNREICEDIDYNWLVTNRKYVDPYLFKDRSIPNSLPAWVERLEIANDKKFEWDTSLFNEVFEIRSDFPLLWTKEINCIVSYQYTDAAGFTVKSSPSPRDVFVDERDHSKVKLKSIMDCINSVDPEFKIISYPKNVVPTVFSCGVENSVATITNVQNFTNLRQQAGLNGQVIGQVPLGASVSVVNPGNFLRYDRCAATCNGKNQNAIKQCIDNNDVWIEVEHNGRRGFLSRKFLE